MKEDSLSLIDSNILVYSIDSSENLKHLKAKKILSECWLNKRKCAISLQNLSEFFVIATTKVEKPISKEKCAKIVDGMIEFGNFIKLEPTSRTVRKAIDISAKENTSYWDALIAATMLENNVFHIYTENTKDFRISGITAINPFEN